MEAEIHRRKRLGWVALEKFSRILKMKKIQQHRRTRIFDQYVLHVATRKYTGHTDNNTKINRKVNAE